jgi:hypothetical protein
MAGVLALVLVLSVGAGEQPRPKCGRRGARELFRTIAHSKEAT